MGKEKLRTKLQFDSGGDVSIEKTMELINAHKTVYAKYWEWVKRISEEYKTGTPLSTTDGWVLFCDNPIITSVRNFLVQANAASITRLAVVRCWEMGLKVMCSLHDAIYVISSNPEIDKDVLEEIMLYATGEILRERSPTMRIDTKIISSDEVWVEEKGELDYNKIKEFLS